MSNQCKNCDRDRDLNNNFVGYPSGYITNPANTNNNNRNTASAMTNNSGRDQRAAREGTRREGAIDTGGTTTVNSVQKRRAQTANPSNPTTLEDFTTFK
jgi:hypothetical protein